MKTTLALGLILTAFQFSRLQAAGAPDVAGTAPPAAGALDTEGLRIVAQMNRVRPLLTTVTFVVLRRQGEQVQRVNGSVHGLLVDKDGLVMVIGEIYPRTADRVVGTAAVDPPEDVKVMLQAGKEMEATFVGKDYDLNVAFVRTKTPPEGVEPLPLAKQGALAVGQAVTVFSLLPKYYGGDAWFTPVRVAAAATEPRELYFASDQLLRALGGPVVDAEGQLVGVVALDTRSVTPEDGAPGPVRVVSTAVIVPAWALAPLFENPPTVRPSRQDGWLGVGMSAVSKDLAAALKLPVTGGVMVSQVYPGTPAYEAGLKAEDVIVAADGQPLTVAREEDLVEFRKLVVAAGAGAKMTLTIYRGGAKQDVAVTLQATPKSADEADRAKLDDFGFTAREVVFTDRIQPGQGPDLAGVVVAAVEPAGWAGLGGLRVNDVVQRINDLPVTTLAQFRAHIRTLREGKPAEVVLFVQRGTETAFIRVQPQWK